MTPMQAIVSATANGAGASFRSKDLGTIEKGKIADLVLLELPIPSSNPQHEKVKAVFAQGQNVDLAALPEHPASL